MCELLAISSNVPVDVDFSLAEFSRHGGETGPHKDGWGITYYEGRDVRQVREPEAANDSDWVRFIEAHHLRSHIVMSHIRYATVGKRILANTQPFTRELGGHIHTFAHNGDIPDVFSRNDFRLSRFAPVGDTDSEHAYCHLMDQMAEVWRKSSGVPALDVRRDVIIRFAERLRTMGSANFIYTDGELVFAHGHRRRWSGPDSDFVSGLHILCRQCQAGGAGEFMTPGLAIARKEPGAATTQNVVLVASVPLTDEAWSPLTGGEIAVITNGKIVDRINPGEGKSTF